MSAAAIKLSAGGERAVRALAGNGGSMYWEDLRLSVLTSDQGLTRIVNQLVGQGVALNDHSARMGRWVNLTKRGQQAAAELGFGAGSCR